MDYKFDAHASATRPLSEVLSSLHTSSSLGLSTKEAELRNTQFGLNSIQEHTTNPLQLFFRQVIGNPLVILLTCATALSFALGERVSSLYIFGMIVLSVGLGFWNEYQAERTVRELLKKIARQTTVIRDGVRKTLSVSHLTIGDVVVLSQGDIIPADVRIIVSQDCTVNQSSLTGESLSVQKVSDDSDEKTKNITEYKNLAFMGTSLESGELHGVVVAIGADTSYGSITERATFTRPQTTFEKGLSSFGVLLMRVMAILISTMMIVNVLLGHAFIESALFALAIAVGLTPELLPVIVTVSLSHGAGRLAKKHVVVRKLVSLENLGNMDVLCTDKTGTLTEGVIAVHDSELANGVEQKAMNQCIVAFTSTNEAQRSTNSIDAALRAFVHTKSLHSDQKIKQHEPFHYEKKMSFVVVEHGQAKEIYVKGSAEVVLKHCEKHAQELLKHVEEKEAQGYRCVMIASKKITKKSQITWNDIEELKPVGFMQFSDTPRSTASDAIRQMASLNVDLKVITGDNEIVAKHVCEKVGMKHISIILGDEMDAKTDSELDAIINTYNVFARVTPAQKMRVIQSLRRIGHTVGYIGDGINDIPSLREADVGICVNTAVDVAKEAASVVLLSPGLQVIADGIMVGRHTFRNTMKYILMGTSSNFGNMVSAALASFFLPFLPMTPVQILLTNGVYDISQLSIPTDRVDPESLLKPKQWNISFIQKYMMFFGPVSSLYDILTFVVLYTMFHARGSLFQTGWFLESMATQILVVFVIRTAKSPFFKSRPSFWLAFTCLGLVSLAYLIPFSPLAKDLGFVVPPTSMLLVIFGLVGSYLILVELMKNMFFKRYAL